MGKGRKRAKEREKFMLMNGSLLLEKRISYFNGRYCNPIRNFTSKEIERATGNYSSSLIIKTYGGMGGSTWYRSCLDGQMISVRKYLQYYDPLRAVINEIALASQISTHKNALKLLGCCLETQIPILVYEFPSIYGSLDTKIFNCNQPLPWKNRLKIAYEIATVIAYLHTAFPKSIIHRNIKSSIFFLDNDCAAKLSDVALAITIPEGKTQVEDVSCGTVGYVAPEVISGTYTEKVDVFSFGILILELLTGRSVYSIHDDGASLYDYLDDRGENYGIDDIVDPKILAEGGGMEKHKQFQSMYELALKCAMGVKEERPTITDAAKEIKRIQRFVL